jgi:hydrogenase expression/formation protein HypE
MSPGLPDASFSTGRTKSIPHNAKHVMSDAAFSCPLPDKESDERVSLTLGEGGRVMRLWLRQRLIPLFHSELPATLHDAAWLPAAESGLAFTTDSFVVSPLEFPGGDIGRLAVFGTVNDLVVSGADPQWLSLSLILEEGFLTRTLDRILSSIARAAREAGVEIVTGDTKVVPRGVADGMFITTSGVGRLTESPPQGPEALQPGDVLIVTGPVGRHGVAILAARESLGFEPPPESDCAPLVPAFAALLSAGVTVRAMRDATRGGVAAVLHEFSEACGHTMWIDEKMLPTSDVVRGVCEVLGLDSLHLACEGTMVCVVPKECADEALAALRSVNVSRASAAIGSVRPYQGAPVVVRRLLGREQALDEPSGAPLPRIC